MELGLRLGDTLHDEKPLNDLIDISNEKYYDDDALGFCMRLTPPPSSSNLVTTTEEIMNTKTDPSAVQLHLLPFSPLRRPNPIPCLLQQPQNQNFLNLKHSVDAGTGSSSSPNSSTMSSFRKVFAVYKRDQHHHHHHHNHAVEADHRSKYINNYSRKRGSDDEDENNGVLLSRKKLRLTKDQSAFLEHSFKLHHTLNPKQKLALAKQLKLRPRQVEVWFQNRRARTKLKQTEVDCEYLKRCCETLREENKRLQKEVQELRALKSCKPNYMQLLPPTTLTMCPSCERLTPPTTVTVAAAAAAPPPPPPDTKPKPPRLHTFLQEYQSHALQAS